MSKVKSNLNLKDSSIIIKQLYYLSGFVIVIKSAVFSGIGEQATRLVVNQVMIRKFIILEEYINRRSMKGKSGKYIIEYHYKYLWSLRINIKSNL